MGYWERADQPFYYSLASVFPIADRYFCSVLGQTYPNRRYLISATSIGQVNDTTAGADRLPGERDHLRPGWTRPGSAGRTTTRDAADRLELYPELYLKNAGTKVVPIADFFTDAPRARCPASAWSSRTTAVQSEEDPQNIASGEQFAAQVINAVMTGPGWERTLLIWTYDEHGGYYDHVPPPPGHRAGRHPAGRPGRRVGLQRLRPVRLPGAVRGRLAVGPARTTSRTGSSTTPASARWSRPSGTCPR